MDIYSNSTRVPFAMSLEMQAVFGKAIAKEQRQKSTIMFPHELIDLPNNLLKAYAAERPLGWETAMKKKNDLFHRHRCTRDGDLGIFVDVFGIP